MLFWEHYLVKIDMLIHESLVLNVRWSMKNNLLQRNDTVFLFNVGLHGSKVRLVETLLLQNIFDHNLLIDMIFGRLNTIQVY